MGRESTWQFGWGPTCNWQFSGGLSTSIGAQISLSRSGCILVCLIWKTNRPTQIVITKIVVPTYAPCRAARNAFWSPISSSFSLINSARNSHCLSVFCLLVRGQSASWLPTRPLELTSWFRWVQEKKNSGQDWLKIFRSWFGRLALVDIRSPFSQDTAGQERFHALGPIYYRDSNGAILVYDITDEDSFQKVRSESQIFLLRQVQPFCVGRKTQRGQRIRLVWFLTWTIAGEELGEGVEEDVGERHNLVHCGKQNRHGKGKTRFGGASRRVRNSFCWQIFSVARRANNSDTENCASGYCWLGGAVWTVCASRVIDLEFLGDTGFENG